MLDRGRFLDIAATAIFQPIIVNIPGARLRQNSVSHNRSRRKQTEEPELS